MKFGKNAMKNYRQPEFSARALIEKSNVKFIGTTDDPISTLRIPSIIEK